MSELDLLRSAQDKSDGLIDQAITAGQTVMVETVLSSAKFELRVARALKAGLLFGFVYVTLKSAKLNVARVRERVLHGGHDVPPDRILARRARSHAAVTWFARRAMIGVILDNSGARPEMLAEKRIGDLGWRATMPDVLTELGITLP